MGDAGELCFSQARERVCLCAGEGDVTALGPEGTTTGIPGSKRTLRDGSRDCFTAVRRSLTIVLWRLDLVLLAEPDPSP
ncbi:guanine nucleotide-binding protein G(I)/G(S)/G(O) subunit gamma-7 isoform X1 [Phalacrocorax aristotelis]|uniref:guanine nucleotide-binding protein G(I)/G(S)/G(O) subunit gamma-7 isoform X1 n=1 Tax=Phalacrocorax aristotelis TaxID=126867 RepID=UPI003F4BEB31